MPSSSHHARLYRFLILFLLTMQLSGFMPPAPAWPAAAASSATTEVVTLIVDRYMRRAGSDGRITSSLPGIDCGPASNPDSACQAQFPKGATVQLTVTPEPGSTFIGWVGSSQEVISRENPLSVTLDEGQILTAGFSQNTVEVTFTFTDGSGHAGMPLFGTLYVSWPNHPAVVYHPDPIHGQVTVLLDQGEDYIFYAESEGYITQTRTASYSTPTASESFDLLPDPFTGCPIGYQKSATTAPVTVLDESFEGSSSLPTGWSLVLYSDLNPSWKVASEGYTGGSSVFHEPVSDDSSQFLDHLVSAQVHIPAQAKLTFYQKSKLIDNYKAHMLLLYHPHGGISYLATPARPTQENTWQKAAYDLSAYAGQDLSIAFLYQAGSPSGDQWFIDDVKIEGNQGDCQPLSGGRVAGYVTAATGSPIFKAGVTAGGSIFTTPANGQYYLWLPTGSATLTAFATRWAPKTAAVTAAANAVTRQDFVLDPGYLLAIPAISR